MMRFVGSVAVATLVAYVAFAFATWGFNPGEWSSGERTMCVVLWVFAFFVAVTYPGWDR